MQVRLTSFLIIAPLGFYFLIEFIYVSTRSLCTKSHGFISAIILGVRCLKVFFIFFNFLHILNGLAYIYA